MLKEQQESQLLKFSYYKVRLSSLLPSQPHVQAGTAHRLTPAQDISQSVSQSYLQPSAGLRLPSGKSRGHCGTYVKLLQRTSARSAGRVPVHQPEYWRGRFRRAWKIVDTCQRGPGGVAFKARRRFLVAQPGLVILLTSCCRIVHFDDVPERRTAAAPHAYSQPAQPQQGFLYRPRSRSIHEIHVGRRHSCPAQKPKSAASGRRRVIESVSVSVWILSQNV